MSIAQGMSTDPGDGGAIATFTGTPVLVRLLDRIGIRRLLPEGFASKPIHALTAYSVLVVLLENGVLQLYNLWAGYEVVYLTNPLRLLNAAMLVGAAMATGALYRRYGRAVERSHLVERASSTERFAPLVPDRLTAALVLVGVAFTTYNAVAILTLPELYAVGGPERVLRFAVILPLGYVPVFATFLATYLSVEVLLPWRLLRSEVDLDFLDPEKLGGMRPFGELVKFAYYYLMLGLVGYAVALYGPFLLSGVFAYTALERPGAVANLGFTAVWAAAVVTMGWGIYALHRYMNREKREQLHRLDRRAREHIDDPWRIENVDIAEPPAEYERYRTQVEYITSTKEYPATFTMWSQIAVGIVAPKALQVVLSVV